jgi:MscS family membrane protein
MKTMKKYWVFIINVILLFGVLYLKFFNTATSKIIADYYQLQSILAFVIFYIAINFLSNTAKYFYSKKNKIPFDKKNNVHFGIENIANFTFGAGLFIMFLSIFGINPSELITSLHCCCCICNIDKGVYR